MADGDDTPANAPVGAVGDETGTLEGDASGYAEESPDVLGARGFGTSFGQSPQSSKALDRNPVQSRSKADPADVPLYIVHCNYVSRRKAEVM